MPYERIIARLIGDHYNYPLDPAKQLSDIKSLEELPRDDGPKEEPNSTEAS